MSNKTHKITEAVLIIFVSGDELYFVKRQNNLHVFPGYHSFPGGKVDKEDYSSPVPQRISLGKDIPHHLMSALMRESKEEVQFDFERASQDSQIISLRHIGIATTPSFNPYRFRTYFYLVRLKEKVNFLFDRNEVEIGQWINCEKFLKLYYQGELLLVPPIVSLVQELNKNLTTETIHQLDLYYDEKTEVPCIESIYGVRQLPVLSHTLPPADRTNAFLIGDEVRYLVDPSPRSKKEMEKLICVVKKIGVHGIFLTHSHNDHHEFSNQIARFFSVPMKMSLDTYDRISASFWKKYWSGIEVDFLKEGDVLTHWLGERVLIYSVPGHDEGQLALAPESMKWFIVGDLIQGTGTVVVAAPEGDMIKYYRSLQKVIDLNPLVVFPSHGIGMGGTYFIKKTLEHREMREEQILNFHREGLSQEDILQKIYGPLPRNLQKLGLCNIESHFKKLRTEGKIQL